MPPFLLMYVDEHLADLLRCRRTRSRRSPRSRSKSTIGIPTLISSWVTPCAGSELLARGVAPSVSAASEQRRPRRWRCSIDEWFAVMPIRSPRSLAWGETYDGSDDLSRQGGRTVCAGGGDVVGPAASRSSVAAATSGRRSCWSTSPTPPALHDAEIVLHDIDPVPLPRMVELAEHLARVRGIGLRARAPPTGGPRSRAPTSWSSTSPPAGSRRCATTSRSPSGHGVRQSVGDTVGPGGVLRALRNIPVFLDIAADMADRVPRRVDAQPHQPDDHDLPCAHPRDGAEDRRPLPRDHHHAVPVEPAARRELPRSHR